MKYKGKISYPKIGDEIKINRYGKTPYKVVSLKYNGLNIINEYFEG